VCLGRRRRARVVFRFRFTQAQVSAIEMLSDPATLGELDLEMLPA
jgi:hypothetical protein